MLVLYVKYGMRGMVEWPISVALWMASSCTLTSKVLLILHSQCDAYNMVLDYTIYGQGRTGAFDVTHKVTVEDSSHVTSYTGLYRYVYVAQTYLLHSVGVELVIGFMYGQYAGHLTP